MAAERRWDPCVAHRGDEVESFIAEYFADANRMVLFIAGAGFRPPVDRRSDAFSAGGRNRPGCALSGKPAEADAASCGARDR